MSRIFKFASVLTILVLLLSAVGIVAAGATKEEKVTICHRTNSTTNPYVQETVAQSSVDGDLSNDHGNGDHFVNHVGPVWNSSLSNGGDWGDIIPPINGVHDGLNWDATGQAIYANGCVPPVVPPPPPGDASAGVSVSEGCVPAGTLKDVSYSTSHASITIAGQTYSGNGTIQLPAGTYSWSSTADSGYQMTGTSSGQFTIAECPPPPPPGEASVSVSVQSCAPEGGLATVSIFVTHATLSIAGQTFTGNGTIQLAAGSYPWSATPDSGFVINGDSSGTATVTTCPPPPPPPGNAHASVRVGEGCVKPGETKEVTIRVSHATLTIAGQSFTDDASINLGAGTYIWSAVPEEGYELETSSGGIVIAQCEQQDAYASVNAAPGCINANETKSVTVSVLHATVSIAGQSFSSDGSLDLGVGTYPWSATPDEGYALTGGSSGTVVISECPPEPQPGSASVTIGECKIDPLTGEALAEVIVKVNNATVHISTPDGDQDISNDTTLWLPEGDFDYSWEASSGYTGSGEGTVKVTPDCKPAPKKFVCLFAPCGPHQEEWAKQPDDVVVVHYSYGDCRCVRGGRHVWDDLRVYMRSIHPFSILVPTTEEQIIKENKEIDTWNARADTGTYNGVHQQHLAYHVDVNGLGVKLVYLDAQAFTGVDDVTYYILDVTKSLIGSGNWPIYDATTKTLYAESYGLKSVTRSVYIACSRSYGPWDIRADGVAIRPMGVTSWEVTWWLWTNGYAPHTWQGWLQLDKWTDAMWLLGQAQLPSK